MITCKECGSEYLSIWRECYPGGAETGCTVLLWGILQLLVGLVLCALAFLFSRGVLWLFVVLFLLMGAVKIWTIPDNMRTILEHGGNKCPNCGKSNELRWYN
jgi:hypothetical protein